MVIKPQQTLLVAEVFNFSSPVDGFHQLPLAFAGMAPSRLKGHESERGRKSASKANTPLGKDRGVRENGVWFSA